MKENCLRQGEGWATRFQGKDDLGKDLYGWRKRKRRKRALLSISVAGVPAKLQRNSISLKGREGCTTSEDGT